MKHIAFCDGPECPRCGCRDTKIFDRAEPLRGGFRDGWWRGAPDEDWLRRVRQAGMATGGNHIETFRCKHCGEVFMAEMLPPPPQPPPAPPTEPAAPVESRCECPKCGAVAKAYCTKKGVQYRRCPTCDHRFKTAKLPTSAARW